MNARIVELASDFTHVFFIWNLPLCMARGNYNDINLVIKTNLLQRIQQ